MQSAPPDGQLVAKCKAILATLTPSSGSHEPTHWSELRKWTVNLVACYVTFIVGLNATALTAAVSETNETFRVSDEVFPNSYWPVTAWNMGAALTPMVILPFMENRGMRPGYLVSYVLFILFVIPQAVARNFSTFIICRFFAGCCGGVLQNVMDGIIADMWEKSTQRSLPVTSYVFALLAGVSMGPVFGGLIVQSLEWRWIHYIQLIIYGVSAPAVFLLFRETRSSVIVAKAMKSSELKSKPESVRSLLSTMKDMWSFESVKSFVKENMLRPGYFLTTEPVVFFFTLLSALSFGLLFMATQSVPQVYSNVYAFTESQSGLIQASIVIGQGIGFLICAFVGNPYFAKAYMKDKSFPSANSQLPEVRLHLAIPSLLIGLTGGLFIYGWTSFANISSWAPTTGLLLLGFGSMVVIQAVTMYITDSYLKYAASATAALVLGENVFAAFLPLAVQSMYTKLGFHWASSLLAFLALLLGVAPIVLVWKGRTIRRKSPILSEMMEDASEE